MPYWPWALLSLTLTEKAFTVAFRVLCDQGHILSLLYLAHADPATLASSPFSDTPGPLPPRRLFTGSFLSKTLFPQESTWLTPCTLSGPSQISSLQWGFSGHHIKIASRSSLHCFLPHAVCPALRTLCAWHKVGQDTLALSSDHGLSH